MRTKNPFCTTIQLSALRALDTLQLPAEHGYINEMAKSLDLSSASLSRALKQLERAGHVERRKDERRSYRPSFTGDILLKCAAALDLYARGKR